MLPIKKRNSIMVSESSERAKFGIIAKVSEKSALPKHCLSLLSKMCYTAAQFQRHTHRGKLLTSDISKASQFYAGRSVPNQVEESEAKIIINKLHIEECSEVENIICCEKYLNHPESGELEMDANLHNYFVITMKAVFSTNDDIFKAVLKNIKTNSNIQPLIPIFVDNICDDLVMINYDRNHLQKLLLVLVNLFENIYSYFHHGMLFKLLNFVLFCTTSSLSSLSPCEGYFEFRNHAAEFLSDIIKNIQCDILYDNTLEKMQNILSSPELKFISCYGILGALIAIGPIAVAHIIPSTFHNISNVFQDFLKVSSSEVASKNQHKFLEVCAILLKYYLYEAVILSKERLNINIMFSDENEMKEYENLKSIPLNLELCCDILNYFGEEINCFLPKLKNDKCEEILLMDFIMLMNVKHETGI